MQKRIYKWRFWPLWFSALAAIIGCTKAIASSVPDPISESELKQIGQWLWLSDLQKANSGHVYDKYLASISTQAVPIRARLDNFVQEALADAPSRVPILWNADSLMWHIEYMTTLKSLDESFFDELSSGLTAPQQARLQFVRSERALRRILAHQFVKSWFGDDARFDFKGSLAEAGIDEVNDGCIATLTAFNAKIEASLQILFSHGIESHRVVQSRNDDGQIAGDYWCSAAARGRPTYLSILAQTREFCSELDAGCLVDPEVVRAVHFARTYPDAFPGPRRMLLQAARMAIKLRKSDPAMVDALHEIVRVYLTKEHELAREHLVANDLINSIGVRQFGTEWVVGTEWGLSAEQIAEIQLRGANIGLARLQLSIQASETIAQLVGKRLLRDAVLALDKDEESDDADRRDIGLAESESILDLGRRIPHPLSRTWLEAVESALGFAPHDAVTDIYTAYLGRYELHRKRILAELAEHRLGYAARESPDQRGMFSIRFSPEEEVNRAFGILRESLALCRQEDRRLMVEIAETLPNPGQRDRFATFVEAMWAFDRADAVFFPIYNNEDFDCDEFSVTMRPDSLNLLALLGDPGIDPARVQNVVDIVAAQSAAILAAYDSAVAIAIDSIELQSILRGQSEQGAAREQQEWTQIEQRYTQLGREVMAMRHAWVAHRFQMYDAMCQALGRDGSVERAHVVFGWLANVGSTEDDVLRCAQRAATASDIPGSTRESIVEIQAEYRDASLAIRNQMIQIANESLIRSDGRQAQVCMKLGQLTFDLEQARGKAIRGMRRLVSERHVNVFGLDALQAAPPGSASCRN